MLDSARNSSVAPRLHTTAPKVPKIMNASLMVVDDDPDIRMTLWQVLTEEGFDVVTASNGFEALERVAQREPAIIVLDLLMPTLDGWGVLSLLKAARAHIPVIVLSAHPNVRSEPPAGATCCVEKPVSMERLLLLIQAIGTIAPKGRSETEDGPIA